MKSTTAFAAAAAAALLVSAAPHASAQGTSARILMFHDVSFTDGKAAASDDVYPDNFRDMMEFLDRHYNIISLDQLVAWKQGAGSIPNDAVVITFDDNYEGVQDYAQWIMQEKEQVGINFAHTAYVGVFTSKDHADWDELRQQEIDGVLQVESHTHTHPFLTQTSNAFYELDHSKSLIDSQIPGKSAKYIAYPYGDYNSSTISLAQSAGYVAGVTTQGGLNYLSTPLFELRRNGVGIDIRLSDFRSIMGFSGSDPDGPVIIDNAESGFSVSGSWSTVGSKSNNLGTYGNTYRRANRSSSQTATARFTPSLSGGLHDVFVWHSSEADPYQTSGDVTHRIRHKSGTMTKVVNQRLNKAGWYYLGRYDFNSGTSGYLEISNAASTGSYVGADAAKFQPVNAADPTPVTPIIVDNGTSDFASSGAWITSTSGDTYGPNNLVIQGGGGAATADAAWSADIPRAGYYEITTWFTVSNSTYRSDSVPYSVSSADGLETIFVNQQSSADGGRRFNSLGVHRFDAGQQDIAMMTNAIASTSQYVSADAIRIDWVADADASNVTEVIVDNGDTGFSSSVSWFPSTSVPGYYAANYHARSTGSVSDAATWTVDLPESGDYTVYARWTTGGNRATAAPYIIYHNSGSDVVTVNQQANNGVWVSLGTYTFSSGSADRVKLSCWTSSGSFVIADAVKFVKQ